jgi:hypothetical protein
MTSGRQDVVGTWLPGMRPGGLPVRLGRPGPDISGLRAVPVDRKERSDGPPPDRSATHSR